VDIYHPTGNSVVTKNSNFVGRTSNDIPHSKSAGVLRNKPSTPPSQKQPLGRTRIINTNEVDYNPPRYTKTPQKKQKVPSHPTTEIINRSKKLPSHVTEMVDRSHSRFVGVILNTSS